MASSRVEVPDIVRERVRQWNPIDGGRVSGVFALLSYDDWRRAHQVDLTLSQTDQEELTLEGKVVFVDKIAFLGSELVLEERLVWDVTHSGVRVMFIKGDDDGDIFVLSIEIVGL